MYLVIVKLLGSVHKAVVPADPAEPTTKECPYCLSIIPYKARKCANCTADLPENV
jgi:large conductance mechanosensitive channel